MSILYHILYGNDKRGYTIMTQDMLQSFALSKGYKWIGDGMAGSCRGYPFVTRLQSKRISVLTTVFTISGKFPGKVGRRLKKELPKHCSLNWSQGLTLICSGQDGELLETYASSLEKVTCALREEGICVPDQCPYCRKTGCDALALLGRTYTPIHRACCEEQAYSTATRAEVNAKQGSYVTGLIGALLGGFVAILPSLLTIWLMDRIYSILFVLIPLGAYHGYRLFRGRMNRFAGVITIVISLIMPFILEQALFYLAVATTFGILPSVLDTVMLYFDFYTPSEMALSMAKPYIFLALGLWVTFRTITRTSAHEVADASAVLDSMTPYQSSTTTRTGPERENPLPEKE